MILSDRRSRFGSAASIAAREAAAGGDSGDGSSLDVVPSRYHVPVPLTTWQATPQAFVARPQITSGAGGSSPAYTSSGDPTGFTVAASTGPTGRANVNPDAIPNPEIGRARVWTAQGWPIGPDGKPYLKRPGEAPPGNTCVITIPAGHPIPDYCRQGCTCVPDPGYHGPEIHPDMNQWAIALGKARDAAFAAEAAYKPYTPPSPPIATLALLLSGGGPPSPMAGFSGFSDANPSAPTPNPSMNPWLPLALAAGALALFLGGHKR